MRRRVSRLLAASTILAGLLAVGPSAQATPVCTDGYMGGLPLSACGGRVFPEANLSTDYIQFNADPLGFKEFRHGMEFLAQEYPRWISIFTLRDHYGSDLAVSAGDDGRRATDPLDTGDGLDIFVVKLTDHDVPDEGKETLLYSLSVHGDEKGGVEGGARAIEDLAIAAGNDGQIVDGISGYESTTGREPTFHSYPVSEVLANEVVYFVDFNADGWSAGDHFAPDGTPNVGLYTRENSESVDLNRQVPTVGYVNTTRNPLEEQEMYFGHMFMHEVAALGVGGKLAYGADIHGEGQSRAWVDIMYPAGQFDSVKHRRLMSIAERTKSVIDETLFAGIVDAVETATGGDAGEGIEDTGFPKNTVPTKPARWGTVWDTLGYTDTGFIGDYLATELGVTGMDYEIALNHSDSRAYGRPWGVILQENYINATRAIIKTALAYAMTEREDFADFQIDPGGQVGYLFDPRRVTSDDGIGVLAGPNKDGISRNGIPAQQHEYSASQLDFFADTSAYVKGGIAPIGPAKIAADPSALDQLDSLVIADLLDPQDATGAEFDNAAYLANLKSWVERGGNLVLTDRALHLLGSLDVVDDAAVRNITVYQPYSNIRNFDSPMVAGLRRNARQLSEATLVGYGIGNNASPMTIVDKLPWEAAGGLTVGTTGNNAGTSDGQTQTSVGQISVGLGQIRILGGGLPTPSEGLDHRFGLKDYSLTYSGLFILENSIKHDAPNLGPTPIEDTGGLFGLL